MDSADLQHFFLLTDFTSFPLRAEASNLHLQHLPVRLLVSLSPRLLPSTAFGMQVKSRVGCKRQVDQKRHEMKTTDTSNVPIATRRRRRGEGSPLQVRCSTAGQEANWDQQDFNWAEGVQEELTGIKAAAP